jgi:tetratricopeptide (TPR) repeat protein
MLFLRRSRPTPAGPAPGDIASATVADNARAEHITEPPPTPPPVPTAAIERDTLGAVAALELALAYLEEVREAATPDHDDKDARKHLLNTLALAAKQLELANKLDSNAVLEGEDDAIPYRFTVNELKAEALLLEGITHQRYDIRRAIPALTAATKLNPNSARAFYVLGLVHAANMNKAQSVAAFERAVALDPKNIAYRKELNRTQNLSAAEVAGYKVTRAGERVFDGAVTTWNVFAVIWNILTFPLRVVLGIFRLLRLHPFA